MSLDFKKTALNALLPALMMTQAGFSSARSSSVSRSSPVRSVVAASQTEATQTGEAHSAEQANPFAAFGSAGHQEQLVQQEPAAETLAFLAEQGLLEPGAELQATESGQNFIARKEFAAFPSPAGFTSCNKPSPPRPANYLTVQWANNGVACSVFDGFTIVAQGNNYMPNVEICMMPAWSLQTLHRLLRP